MKYKDHFNHLGQMRHGDHNPWTTADLIIIALCLAGIVCLVLEKLL
jgi:hypothetical protein